MRILLLSLQLAVLGGIYLVVAIPVLVMLTGFIYLLVQNAAAVLGGLMGAAGFAAGVALKSLMASLGLIAPVAVTTVSLSGVASTLLVIASPMLAAILCNLVCGTLAYYRDWHRKARKWAIVVNCVVLALYALVQTAILMDMAKGFDPTPGHEPLSMSSFLWTLLFFVLWDSFPAVNILLLFRMPARPDAALTAKRLPAAHIALWALLAAAFVLIMIVAGIPLSGVSIAACAVVLLSILPFLLNLKATGKIAGERKKAYAILVFCANCVVTLFCLLFLPPIGVALFLSTVLLFFALEMFLIKKEGPTESLLQNACGEPAPVPADT